MSSWRRRNYQKAEHEKVNHSPLPTYAKPTLSLSLGMLPPASTPCMKRTLLSPPWHAHSAFQVVPVPLKSPCPKPLWMYPNTYEYFAITAINLATEHENTAAKQKRGSSLYSLYKINFPLVPLACPLCLPSRACATGSSLQKSQSTYPIIWQTKSVALNMIQANTHFLAGFRRSSRAAEQHHTLKAHHGPL